MGDQAQAWSTGLAGGLAHLSNHRVSGNYHVCVVESVQLVKRVQRLGAGRKELRASMAVLVCGNPPPDLDSKKVIEVIQK